MRIFREPLETLFGDVLRDPLVGKWGGPGNTALSAAISAWQASQSAVRVAYSGPDTFSTATNVSGSTTGRTFVVNNAPDGIRQDGLIRSIDYNCNQPGSSQWKFSLWRPRANGTDYDKLAETTSLTPLTGLGSVVLDTPWPCIPGDRLGVFLPGGTIGTRGQINGASAQGSIFVAGDASAVVGGTTTSCQMALKANGTPPFLVGTGDSIMEGHNSASVWHSFYDTGPAGNPASELLHQMRALTPTLEYQNYAKSSQTWAFVASVATGIAAQKSRAVIVQCGVNDVAAGRLWADIQTDMDTLRTALAPGQTLFVNEILPWIAGSDAQAATIRTFNGNYATWCSANGAVLVPVHDPMAEIRSSTGQLDNMKAAYNYGSIHLSVPDGVNACALLMTTALNAYPWP